MKNSGNNLKYRFIVVVALFRAVTCRGDDMAWLDPCYMPIDYAYSAMRGVMLRIFQHNAVSHHNKIKTVHCPDFFKVNSITTMTTTTAPATTMTTTATPLLVPHTM